MKKQPCFGSIVLIVLLVIFCSMNLLAGIFAPMIFLPKLDMGMVLLISLSARVIQGLVQGKMKIEAADMVISAAAFGILPWCTGIAGGMQGITLCVIGGAAYGITGFLLYGSVQKVSVKPVRRLALIINGMILFLAFQSLSGMFL